MSFSQLMVLLGALAGGSGVVLGAFAAHGLRGRLTEDALGVFQTGVTYQLVHALALLFVGLAARHASSVAVSVAGWAFVAGIVLFSGSLYALALGGPRGLGPITPLGGAAFIIGWIALAVGAWRAP